MKVFNIIATSVLGAAMAIGTGFALANKQNMKRAMADDTVTITPATSGWTSTAGEQTGTVSGITVATENGVYNTQMRVYSGATFTVTSSVGNFSKIVFTFSSGSFSSVDSGTYSSGQWTGGASSVSFSNTAQVRITNIVVTLGSGGGTDPDPDPEPTTEHAGTAEDPYSVADAIAVTPASGTLSGKYVKGYVVGTPNINTSFGNATFDVADVAGGSPTFNIFRVKDIGNAKFTDANKIKAGYTVVAYGDLKTYSSTKELTNGYVVSITEGEAPEPETAETIQEIYSCNSGDNVDVHGYYVGFSTGTGPILMDGEYGIVVYDKTHDVSGYTPNVTKLHIVGALTIYHGLYEINASTIEASSSTDISEPVTYTVTGSETYIHESRHTYVTGIVSSITVGDGKTKWTDDTTINMSVNSKSVKCFAKAGGLDSTITDKIDAALVSGDPITLTGFTGWFDNFQVAVNGLFEASGTYSLNQFVTDFFDETNAICTTYEDGVSDYASFKTQLQAVWTDLNSETKYQDLSETDKDLLRTTVASQEAGASDLQLALARYEFLVLKYKLGDFLERGLITSSNSISLIKNNSVTAIIIVTASIAVISLSGVFFIIRKRKHQ